MLSSGKNLGQLAQQCSVSRRTIVRDVKALRSAGVPVDYDTVKRCYSISSHPAFLQANLTQAEAMALVCLASEMGQRNRIPFLDAARSAAIKLEQYLPSAIRGRLATVKGAVGFQPLPLCELKDKENIYQQIVEARAALRVARVEYVTDRDAEPITTRLRTYQVMFCRHSWYVVGHSSFHGKVCTFNVNRIISLKLMTDRYKVRRGFSLDRYFGNAWQLMPTTGPDYDVVIRFSPFVARGIMDVKWHKTQQVEIQRDDSLLFRVRVSGLHEIVWWILGYGDHAEVLQPARLRRFVAHRARNMVKMYEARH